MSRSFKLAFFLLVVLSLLAAGAKIGYERLFATGILLPGSKNSKISSILLFKDHSHSQLISRAGQLLFEWPCGGKLQPDNQFLCINQQSDGFDLYEEDGVTKHSYLPAPNLKLHHDLTLFNNQVILLNRSIVKNPLISKHFNVIDDQILEVDLGNGEIVWKWSLNDHFAQLQEKIQLKDIGSSSNVSLATKKWSEGKPFLDWSHANSILIARRTFGNAQTKFNKGDIFLSLCYQGALIAINRQSGSISWSFQDKTRSCFHHLSLLPNNNILAFRNGHYPSGSTIIEIDPIQKRIVKSITPDVRNFYVSFAGSAQMASHNTVLVGHTTVGSIYEIDLSGNVLWHYRRPEFREVPISIRIFYQFSAEPAAYKRFVKATGNKIKTPNWFYRAYPISEAQLSKARFLNQPEPKTTQAVKVSSRLKHSAN